ncbi:helix-turn-helix domain-containing protein [Novosphingobium soli]|uniref:Helix-turn-helix domain-containing protein n=1 Tax=Novosphingobium soli TaxID=574956 RepID=A0ABV6CQB2_9SPHN
MEIRAHGKGFGDDRYRALVTALLDARKAAGLTQAEFARALGRRQQFVSLYETGERRLDVVEFCDVARQLGLDPASLIAAL